MTWALLEAFAGGAVFYKYIECDILYSNKRLAALRKAMLWAQGVMGRPAGEQIEIHTG